MKAKKIYIVFLFLALAIFAPSLYKHYRVQQLEKALSVLSPIEKEYLANFFKLNVLTSSFGYVLFGDKPMCFETCDPHAPTRSVEGFDYMDEHHILDRYRVREGFVAWKKIETKLELHKYTLLSFTNSRGIIEIYLINHASFIQKIANHLTDFHTVLNNSTLTPQQIFEGYLSGKYRQQINTHDGLYGTLLGYGRDNAWAYMENDIDSMHFFGTDFETAEPLSILLPLFRSLDSEETRTLAEKYSAQQKTMESIYSSGDFLMPTLLKLTE